MNAPAANAGTLGFSVVTAVFDPHPDHLGACLGSVQATAWNGPVEHVLVDDASTDPRVGQTLSTAVARARRPVVVRTRASNGGIVAASNEAVALASNEWIVLVDHDDVLAPTAIAALAAAIEAEPDVDLVYSDHDILRPDGLLASPVYKPDLSPEWLRQHNYITHLVALRRTRFEAVGGFRIGTDGAQDHDLLLRLIEAGAVVRHVPEVLLHWRQSPRSVAADTGNKPDAFVAGRQVVADHLARCGVRAEVVDGSVTGVYRIDRLPPDPAVPPPRVSVVIPTGGAVGRVWGAERTFVVDAVRSIVERSTHRHLEFVLVVDADTPEPVVDAVADVVAVAGEVSLRSVTYDAPFNFSAKINRGLAVATGELVLLLNDDTELIESTSIERMVRLLEEPLDRAVDPDAPARHDRNALAQPVGAVGAKLLYPDGTLQHGGHLYHGEFMHAFIGWGGDHPGPNRILAVDRECSGVTAAAMLVRRALLDEVGGFPEDLPLDFNDVDVCCSIRQLGYRILWTPHASWYHFEGRSRGRGATMAEWRRAASRWPTERPTDPYANPNLHERRADWLELPGRSGAPPYELGPDGSVIWA